MLDIIETKNTKSISLLAGMGVAVLFKRSFHGDYHAIPHTDPRAPSARELMGSLQEMSEFYK